MGAFATVMTTNFVFGLVWVALFILARYSLKRVRQVRH